MRMFGGNPETERKQKNSTRLGRIGPKSVRMFGGNPETEKKTEEKSNSVGEDGSKVREDVWRGPGTEKKTGKKIEIEPVGKERTQNP